MRRMGVHSFLFRFSRFPDFPIYHLGGGGKSGNREIGGGKSPRSPRKGLHGATTVVQPPRIRLYGFLFVFSIVYHFPEVGQRNIGKTEKRIKNYYCEPTLTNLPLRTCAQIAGQITRALEGGALPPQIHG